MKRKWWIACLSALLSAAAALGTLIPVCCRVLQERGIREAVSRYELTIFRAGEKNLEIHRSLSRWYNRGLRLDPESPEIREGYRSIAFPGDGPMGVLEVPALGWVIPVYHGSTAGKTGAHHAKDSQFPLGIPGDRTEIRVDDRWDMACIREGIEVRLEFLGEKRTYRAGGGASALILSGKNGKIACDSGRGDILPPEMPGGWACIGGAAAAWGVPLGAAACKAALRVGAKRSERRKEYGRILKKTKNISFS